MFFITLPSAALFYYIRFYEIPQEENGKYTEKTHHAVLRKAAAQWVYRSIPHISLIALLIGF